MRIKILPTHIANQIAAGEVIERPASVVKELLENALDARATRINVEIEDHGFQRIKVSDDGTGICAEDLSLALVPHATSKINSIQDLNEIRSLGFRGEALASIAAISRLRLHSKTAEQLHGMELRSNHNDTHALPCPRTQGTTVDVHDIFFNVPVRKKFLKSKRFEFLAIDRVVRCFALGAPMLSLTFSHNGKRIMQLPAALTFENRLIRVQRLLGKNFIDYAVFLDEKHEDIELSGWISQPPYQRSQNDRQWIYLNGRMVKDKLLNHAIKQSYQNRLDPGRYPVCALNLTLNPEQVDVNVHPTKHEVRFQDPRLIHNFIYSSLTAIFNENLRPQKAFNSFQNFAKESAKSIVNTLQSQDIESLIRQPDQLTSIDSQTWLERSPINYSAGKALDAKNLHATNPSNAAQDIQNIQDIQDNQGTKETKYAKNTTVYEDIEHSEYHHYKINTLQANHFPKQINEFCKQSYDLPKPLIDVKDTPFEQRKLLEAYIWVNLNTRFSLIILDAEPYLIDMYVVKHEWLKELWEKKPLPLASRYLAVPIRYDLKIPIDDQFNHYLIGLEEVGIQLTLVGEHVLLVRSLPTDLPHLEVQAFLDDFFLRPVMLPLLLDKLLKHEHFDTQYMQEEEKQHLLRYLASVKCLSPKSVFPWLKHLSLLHCEKWLNV